MKKEISHGRIIKDTIVKYAIQDPVVRRRILPIFIFIIVSKMTEIASIKYSNGISHALKDESSKNQMNLLIFFILCQIVFTFLQEFAVFIFVHPLQIAYIKSSCDVFKSYIYLSYSKFNKIGSGEVFNVIERKSNAVSDILYVCILNTMPVVAFLFLSIPKLTEAIGLFIPLILVISFGGYIYGTIIFTIKRNQLRRVVNLKYSQQLNIMYDSLQNFESVLAYNNRDLELQRYNVKLYETGKPYIKLYKVLNMLNFYQSFMFTIQMSIVIFCGIRGYYMDKMTSSSFLLYIAIVKSFTTLSFKASDIYSKITRALVDIRLEVPRPEKLTGKRYLPFNQKISVRKINLFHDKNLILKDVNFEINKGDKLVILGKNGTGKSSLLKVFLGYTEYTGDIFFDHIRMQDISVISLRDKISYIPQNGEMFNDTVKYNILYGKKDATDQEIYDICKGIDVHKNFQNLEYGYDTVVGERGQFISGGERQKVAFARAILKNGDILILDEPTASLDKESERKILQETFKIYENKTVIMIVHNMTLLDMFNKILYLENETCHEYGSYNELMIKKGAFYRFMSDSISINDKKI